MLFVHEAGMLQSVFDKLFKLLEQPDPSINLAAMAGATVVTASPEVSLCMVVDKRERGVDCRQAGRPTDFLRLCAFLVGDFLVLVLLLLWLPLLLLVRGVVVVLAVIIGSVATDGAFWR